MRLLGFSPQALLLAAVVASFGASLGACNFGFSQGPDRPEEPNVEGPPPPADFHCEKGARHTEDTDHDGHPDRVVHVLGTGAVVCSTEDRNHDGKIDTWNRIENGQTIEQATDTDFDGTLDRRVRVGTLDGPPPPPLVLIPPIKPLLPLRPAGPAVADGGH